MKKWTGDVDISRNAQQLLSHAREMNIEKLKEVKVGKRLSMKYRPAEHADDDGYVGTLADVVSEEHEDMEVEAAMDYFRVLRKHQRYNFGSM